MLKTQRVFLLPSDGHYKFSVYRTLFVLLAQALLLSGMTLAQKYHPVSTSTVWQARKQVIKEALPLREFKIPELQNRAFRNFEYPLLVTLHLLLIEYYDLPARKIVAYDRVTGKELWHLGNREAIETGGKIERVLIGAARSTGRDEMIILKRSLLIQQKQGSMRIHSSHLEGVEALTGKVAWQFPLTGERQEDSAAPAGIYGGLIVLTYPETVLTEQSRVLHYKENRGRSDFLDAFTGKRLDPVTERGKEALKAAVQQSRSPLALLERSDLFCMLHLDTGVLSTLPVSGSPALRGQVMQAAATSRFAMALLRTDDDGAGHSTWPNYIYAVDAGGRRVWQFPRNLIFPGTGEQSVQEEQRHYESIGRMLVLPDSDMVLATGNRQALYGLQVSTGKARWRNPSGASGILSLAAYNKGAFALTNNSQEAVSAALASTLVYIEANTGKQHPLSYLPASRRILVEGDDLFVISNDTIYVYSCRQLLNGWK